MKSRHSLKNSPIYIHIRFCKLLHVEWIRVHFSYFADMSLIFFSFRQVDNEILEYTGIRYKVHIKFCIYICITRDCNLACTTLCHISSFFKRIFAFFQRQIARTSTNKSDDKSSSRWKTQHLSLLKTSPFKYSIKANHCKTFQKMWKKFSYSKFESIFAEML